MSKKRSEVEKEIAREVNHEKWSAWNAEEVFFEEKWKILEIEENMEENMEARKERKEERMEEKSLKKEYISILE